MGSCSVRHLGHEVQVPGAAAEAHIQAVPAGLVNPVGHLMVVAAQVSQLGPRAGVRSLTVHPHTQRRLLRLGNQNLTEGDAPLVTDRGREGALSVTLHSSLNRVRSI